MSHSLLRGLVLAAAATYVVLLHRVYVDVISPAYAYSGLVYRPSSDGSLILAMILAVVPSGWLPLTVSRPSQVTLWMFYVLAYVPGMLIPYYVLGTGFEGVFPLSVAVALCFVLVCVIRKVHVGMRWSPLRTTRGFEHVVLCLALVLGGYIILAFGLRFELPNVADVYDVRASYDLAVANAQAPFIAYAVDWSLYVANPFLMVLGLRSRRYGLFAIGLFLETLGYGITGYKSALLTVAFLIPIYILLAERRRRVFALGIILAPVGVIALAFAWDQATASSLATSIFVRRAIVVPGELLGDYYDFFSQNPTYALGHSILGVFGPPPYSLDPAHLIGAVYFGDPGMNANANLWADGFANFGFAGMFASTVGLGLTMVTLDAFGSGRDLRVTGAMAGVMAFPLANSAILTTMLTHGLGLALLLVLLMPREAVEKESDSPRPTGEGRRADPIDERRALVPG